MPKVISLLLVALSGIVGIVAVASLLLIKQFTLEVALSFSFAIAAITVGLRTAFSSIVLRSQYRIIFSCVLLLAYPLLFELLLAMNFSSALNTSTNSIVGLNAKPNPVRSLVFILPTVIITIFLQAFLKRPDMSVDGSVARE
jgi:hypothetical protein